MDSGLATPSPLRAKRGAPRNDRSILPPPPRALSRARAVARFRWSILAPLIALMVLVLLPVLFLQLYFSFHQWTVYLGSWWDAEFVGLELFGEVLTDPRFGWAVVRSLAFATGSTIGCFVFGFALAYLMYKPFRGQAVYYVVFILPMLTVPVVVAYTARDAARTRAGRSTTSSPASPASSSSPCG